MARVGLVVLPVGDLEHLLIPHHVHWMRCCSGEVSGLGRHQSCTVIEGAIGFKPVKHVGRAGIELWGMEFKLSNAGPFPTIIGVFTSTMNAWCRPLDSPGISDWMTAVWVVCCCMEVNMYRASVSHQCVQKVCVGGCGCGCGCEYEFCALGLVHWVMVGGLWYIALDKSGMILAVARCCQILVLNEPCYPNSHLGGTRSQLSRMVHVPILPTPPPEFTSYHCVGWSQSKMLRRCSVG